MTKAISYFGQDTAGWDSIGTDLLKISITEGMDVAGAVSEIQRRCGKSCQINLYKEEDGGEG